MHYYLLCMMYMYNINEILVLVHSVYLCYNNIIMPMYLFLSLFITPQLPSLSQLRCMSNIV